MVFCRAPSNWCKDTYLVMNKQDNLQKSYDQYGIYMFRMKIEMCSSHIFLATAVFILQCLKIKLSNKCKVNNRTFVLVVIK